MRPHEVDWNTARFLLGPEHAAEVRARLSEPDPDTTIAGVMCFVNSLMDSSEFGSEAVVIYGPGLTFQAPPGPDDDPVLWRIGDVPSRFQYLQWWMPLTAFRE